MDFNKWYKNKVESNDQDPPEIVWNTIQDELDIDQSWFFIKDHLDKKSDNTKVFIYSAAAIAIILILSGALWVGILQNGRENLELISTNQNVLNKDTIIVNPLIIDQIAVSNQNNKSKTQSSSDNINNKNELTSAEINDFVLADELRTNERHLAALNISGFIISNNFQIDKLKEMNQQDISTEMKTERIAFTDIYFGATGQFANTWMLNDKTINGLGSNDLTKTNASFGYNVGLFIGTNITKRINMQLDLDIITNNNQNYNEYINGHYVSSSLNFNYSQLALAFKYSKISKRFIRGEHGIILGGYLGYLRNAYQTIDGNSSSILSSYNNLDYGLMLGYEYVIPVYNKIGIGTGFRAYYGLQNIYSGDNYIPAYMNKTNNASINITLSIKYDLK